MVRRSSLLEIRTINRSLRLLQLQCYVVSTRGDVIKGIEKELRILLPLWWFGLVSRVGALHRVNLNAPLPLDRIVQEN